MPGYSAEEREADAAIPTTEWFETLREWGPAYRRSRRRAEDQALQPAEGARRRACE